MFRIGTAIFEKVVMKKHFFFSQLVIFFLAIVQGYGQEQVTVQNQTSALYEKLRSLPGAEIKSIEPESLFTEVYEIRLQQPLDYQHPERETFGQRIYLSHIDFSRPVVLVTEGYAANGNYTYELSRLLKTNQIVVEYRYFGESKPDSLKWEYLTIRQAAADYHRIVTLFKEIYPGKWVNSGISKGGQTAMYHRRFYPNDVDASVCYVAPLNLTREEPRIHEFLNTVGSPECREKIKQFQQLALENRVELLPLIKWYSIGKEYRYPMGLETAFEYAVLEYSFAFWQWGGSSCDSIPGDEATTDELLDHLLKVSGFYYYSETGVNYYAPFIYQAYTEIGYYNYDTSDFTGLLKAAQPNASNIILAPPNVTLTYHPESMRDINDWIQNEGNNMIFIYGELDTWSASAVQLNGKTNALKVVQKGGSHKTRIKTLHEPGRTLVLSTL